MTWFNSIETLSKLIPIAQILIVLLTVFTIWASVHRGNLEKQEKAKLAQEISQTKSVTDDLTNKNIDLDAELKESKTELSDLKKKTEPRSVLLEQKAKLAQLLPPSASFQIAAACRLMDKESCNYAEELIGVFKDLKWQIGKTNQTFLDDIQGDVVVAITEDAQLPVADRISKALNKVGIKTSNETIRKESISGIQANTVYLIVGARKQNL
jgi:vacuolar-type H+-ATPase subunit I/STV1